MQAISQLFKAVLLPSLTGLIVALIILLWNPQGKFDSVRNRLANFLATSPITDVQNSANINAPSNHLNQTFTTPSYAPAVDQAAPAVVNIYTKKIIRRQRHPLFDDPVFQRFFKRSATPQSRVESSLGSGVLMNNKGYILTSNHVIAGADQVTVALTDGREATAMLVGSDADADLAVLKIDLPDLPFIKVANSQNISVGDIVLAIGNPFGVGQTVTMGIVSATGRNQLGLNTYENYIQTDAAINPGNSGGALINAYGELVGINSAIFSKSGGSQGIGFAIPSNNAIRVLKDIARFGHTIRGWIGIQVQEIPTALLSQLNLPETLQGLRVSGLHEQGPSKLAGLMVGDIITELDGMKIHDAKKAMNLVSSFRPEDKLAVKYIRDGQALTTEILVGQKKIVADDK